MGRWDLNLRDKWRDDEPTAGEGISRGIMTGLTEYARQQQEGEAWENEQAAAGRGPVTRDNRSIMDRLRRRPAIPTPTPFNPQATPQGRFPGVDLSPQGAAPVPLGGRRQGNISGVDPMLQGIAGRLGEQISGSVQVSGDTTDRQQAIPRDEFAPSMTTLKGPGGRSVTYDRNAPVRQKMLADKLGREAELDMYGRKKTIDGDNEIRVNAAKPPTGESFENKAKLEGLQHSYRMAEIARTAALRAGRNDEVDELTRELRLMAAEAQQAGVELRLAGELSPSNGMDRRMAERTPEGAARVARGDSIYNAVSERVGRNRDRLNRASGQPPAPPPREQVSSNPAHIKQRRDFLYDAFRSRPEGRNASEAAIRRAVENAMKKAGWPI
ncbi:MAG: hypothetical protein H0W63_03840 [Gemmatimonadaceae bacterium]|nr:hypothetical protein [Gemmatimonadaceae bacterium]